MNEVPKTGKCVVCHGFVIQVVTDVYPKRGAHDKQIKPVSGGFYCTGCGLKYQFLPPSETPT